jgi:integrase
MRGETLDQSRTKAKPKGRHPDKRLTAVFVRNVKKPGRYHDGNGLCLFVAKSGAKRWQLRTVVLGKRCDIGLGSVRLVSLAKARVIAAEMRMLARDGGDPLAERRRKRVTIPTFEEAAKKVHAAHSATFRNQKHKADWLSSLDMYAFPHFGSTRVDAIRPSDILTALNDIWVKRPETARRVRQRLRAVFDWAKASGFRAGDNPVDGVLRALPRHSKNDKTHHSALPYVDVPAFVTMLRDADATESVRIAFEFLILTAARTSEVIGARWSEIDREARCWTIPGVRIKAGKEHRVPLSPRCEELLDRAAAIADGGPYVFPGRYPKRALSNTVFLMLLRRLKRDDITGHGFRSSFRDWCAERTTFPRAVAEAALAHVVKDRTEAAYLRSDFFEQRRSLMETWAAFVTAKKATVVSLRA